VHNYAGPARTLLILSGSPLETGWDGNQERRVSGEAKRGRAGEAKHHRISGRKKCFLSRQEKKGTRRDVGGVRVRSWAQRDQGGLSTTEDSGGGDLVDGASAVWPVEVKSLAGEKRSRGWPGRADQGTAGSQYR